MNSRIPTEAESLTAKCSFIVCVVPSSIWLPTRNNQAISLPWHESVLRPLLRSAREAWAYELKPGTDVFESGRGILKREAGKYRVNLSEEPIRGHELFWNAAGGKRGSIALVFDADNVPGLEIFPHCERAFVASNPSTPHTPAAFRFANSAASRGLVTGMFSRTNGLQWLSFHGPYASIERLFAQARELSGSQLQNAASLSTGEKL